MIEICCKRKTIRTVFMRPEEGGDMRMNEPLSEDLSLSSDVQADARSSEMMPICRENSNDQLICERRDTNDMTTGRLQRERE